MTETIDKNELLKRINDIEYQVIDIINSFDNEKLSYPDIVKKEKELNLLIANKTAYKKLLLKTIYKHPIHLIDTI